MDVKAVRQALADAAAKVKVGGKKVQGLAAGFGTINPPTFFPATLIVNRYPGDDDTNGQLRKWTLVCKLLVGKPDEQAAYEALDALMSDGDADIVAALEVDSTLGGLIVDIRVDGITGTGEHTVSGVPYLGANVGITLWSW